MTRDEHRKKCFEAIKLAVGWTAEPGASMMAAEVLDSLHGIAWLVPVEDTKDWDEEKSQPGWNWRRMSAASDLTNPPEGKP